MDSENEFLDSSHKLAEACVRVTRNRGIALSCGSLTAFAICASSIPPFTTTIAAFLGVSYARFGYLFFLQYLFFTVASLSLGWGKRRFGFSNKSIVALGLVGSGVFSSSARASGASSSSISGSSPSDSSAGLSRPSVP
jgi:fatty-acid desaturase